MSKEFEEAREQDKAREECKGKAHDNDACRLVELVNLMLGVIHDQALGYLVLAKALDAPASFPAEAVVMQVAGILEVTRKKVTERLEASGFKMVAGESLEKKVNDFLNTMSKVNNDNNRKN